MNTAKQIREPRADYLTLEEPALLRGFELLATAEGGVAKLRELVLSLAVQGKLVRQEESDGSASVLLANIAAKKSELAASGKIREPKKRPALASINEDLPPGWYSVVLEDICTVITDGDHLPPPKAETGVPFLVIGDVRSGHIDLSQAERFVSPEYFKALDWSRRPSAGDVLYTTVGSFGIPVLIVRDQDFCFQRHIALLRPGIPTLQPYLYLALRSPAVFAQASSGATGIAQKTVGLAVLRAISVALPPLAEQHRIVSRVEELMTLYDELEARGRLADEQHTRLTTTLFDALTASDSAQTLADNWQRIATHFDLLLDRPQAIDALEQTILQLAVRGLLVPQNASEEPASKLLVRIRAEKSRLIAEGEIKRDKPLPPVGSEEMSFEVPDGWAWARMNHISDNRLGKMLDKAKNTGKLYPYLRNTNVQWQHISLDDLKEIRLEDHEVDEYRLAIGDLLICEGGYPGRCAIWNEPRREMFFQKALHRVRPLCGVLAEYLEICLRTDSQSGALEQYFTGATIKHFAGQELNRYAIPLPPLAEQHRIVARVEHLRRLCDDLRERLNKVRVTQTHLAEALVTEAVQPQRGVRLG